MKKHSLTALAKAVREAFLLDSGASIHLSKRCGLTKDELSRIRKSDIPMQLETVNGSRTATEEVEVWVPALQSQLTFYVVAGRSPNLISLENLCDEQRFHYSTDPDTPPVLWRESDNLQISCNDLCNVPAIAPAVALQSIEDNVEDAEANSEESAGSEEIAKFQQNTSVKEAEDPDKARVDVIPCSKRKRKRRPCKKSNKSHSIVKPSPIHI